MISLGIALMVYAAFWRWKERRGCPPIAFVGVVAYVDRDDPDRVSGGHRDLDGRDVTDRLDARVASTQAPRGGQ